MSVHISRGGFEDSGVDLVVVCDCGVTIGPAPDEEVALDMAMEHAWSMGVADAVALTKEDA